jgi:glyoxylase-like metal-dependent hydrolase (beta-lactamase superfamily II)
LLAYSFASIYDAFLFPDNLNPTMALSSGPRSQPTLNRRKLLQLTALGAVLETSSFPGFAQQSLPNSLEFRPLAGNLLLLTDAGTNIVAMDTPEGLLLTDGGSSEYSEQLLYKANALSATGTIKTLINTNWRPEHSGLNELVSSTLTEIIAHENTRLWMNNTFTVGWENQHYTPRPEHALPTRTFYETDVIETEEETIELGVLPRAHTDGDIYVFFRRANVLVVSDILAVNAWPVIDYNTGGWIGGMLDASEAIIGLADEQTLIIPATGEPQPLSAVIAQRDMCADIMGKVEIAYSEAKSFDEFLATNLAQPYIAERGNPELFLLQVWKGLVNHIRYTRDVYFV